MKYLKNILLTLALVLVSLWIPGSAVKAMAITELKPLTIYVGETRNFSYVMADRVFWSPLGDNEDIYNSDWRMTENSEEKYANQNYLSFKGDNIKGLNPGTITFHYTQTGEPPVWDDEDAVGETYKVSIKIIVKNPATLTKKAAAAAKTFLAGKSSSKTFIFADFSFDGVKDLYYNGKMYFYDSSTNKLVANTKNGKRKITSIYVNSKKKQMMVKTTGTLNKTQSSPIDDNKMYYEYAYHVYTRENRPFIDNQPCTIIGVNDYQYIAKLTSTGMKKFKNKTGYCLIREDEDELSGRLTWVYDEPISKTKFNSYLSGFSALTARKNTAANRSAYLK